MSGGVIHDAAVDRGDVIDRANGVAALAVDLAVVHAAHAARQPIPESAVCLNCGEATRGGARWCDGDCRDDWLRRTGGRP